MLQHLSIKNFAIITECDIDFSLGFTVLTGETGAGKSIIIDAISFLLGKKASDSWIHSGADEAWIEGVFLVPVPFKEADAYLDESRQLIVRRRFVRGKPGLAQLNQQTVPIKLLKQVTAGLVMIIGQHEYMKMSEPEFQLSMIDAYSQSCQSAYVAYFEAYQTYSLLLEKKKQLENSLNDSDQRREFLKFQIDDIEQFSFEKGEEELLELQKREYKNKSKLDQAYKKGLASTQQSSQLLEDALKQVSFILETNEALKPLYESLFQVSLQLSDAESQLSEHFESTKVRSHMDINELESRLDVIFRYKLKYKVPSLDALIDLLEELKSELSLLDTYKNDEGQLDQELDTSLQAVLKVGKSLTKARVETAVALETQIRQKLSFLHFDYCAFDISLDQISPTPMGCDSVRFLISTNKGHQPQPISEVASGGELSRIMLAVQSVISAVFGAPLLIFDEVDTGIGGLTANQVAQFLSEIAGEKQVICITHLAQIAQVATQHLLVAKSFDDNGTLTSVQILDEDSRKNELHRMLGGESVLSQVST